MSLNGDRVLDLPSGRRSPEEILREVPPPEDVLPPAPEIGSRAVNVVPGLEFHGQRPLSAARTIESEKPLHRMMAYLCAAGLRPAKIAEKTEYSVAQVRTIMNQPWFKNLVAVIIHEEFNDDVGPMLKAGAAEAIMELRNLATGANSEAVRAKACSDLLDRHCGKATQHVHHTSSNVPVDAEDEIKQLKEKLQKI